jgi:hypothetical protein
MIKPRMELTAFIVTTCGQRRTDYNRSCDLFETGAARSKAYSLVIDSAGFRADLANALFGKPLKSRARRSLVNPAPPPAHGRLPPKREPAAKAIQPAKVPASDNKAATWHPSGRFLISVPGLYTRMPAVSGLS